MSDPLTTHPQDHLAGALQAIELLKAMAEHYAGEPLGEFATELLVEIEPSHCGEPDQKLGWLGGRAEGMERLACSEGQPSEV